MKSRFPFSATLLRAVLVVSFLTLVTQTSGCSSNNNDGKQKTTLTAPQGAIEQSHYVEVAPNIKIHAIERYIGDPQNMDTVVLLHSAGIDLRMWDCELDDMSMINYLANNGMRVIAVDYRGFGKSTRLENGNTVTIAEVTDDVAKVIRYFQEKENIHKVKVYGTSVGAIVGARLASEYPELVQQLAMTGGFYYSMNETAQNLFPEEFFLKGKSGYFHYSPAMMAKFMPSAQPEVIKWYQDAYPAKDDFPGGLFINFWHLPAVIHPANIQAPVLLVNGQKDIFTTRSDSLKFLSQVGTPDVTYIEEGGIGHAPMIEKGYQDFRKILLDFLKRKV